MNDQQGDLGQTKIMTERLPDASFRHTPIRSLWLLDPSLRGFLLGMTPAVTIGRARTGVNWQIVCPHISRKHCVLHIFEGRARVVRHPNASQPVRVNGVDINRSPLVIQPWTFLELGSKTILIQGELSAQPTERIRLPARSGEERAIQAVAVYGSIRAAARIAGWSCKTLRRRLAETDTGLAMLAWNRRHHGYSSSESDDE